MRSIMVSFNNPNNQQENIIPNTFHPNRSMT